MVRNYIDKNRDCLIGLGVLILIIAIVAGMYFYGVSI